MAQQISISPAVAVLAGRRIDPADVKEPRFPLAESENVARKLLRHFRKEQIKRLTCSAACGADILALEVAEKLAIPATLVIPFSSNIFRSVSVTDRPGEWGDRFDRLVSAARLRGDLVELGLDVNDKNAFTATNELIVQSANTLGVRRLAFVVWEGQTRGQTDATADFLSRALSLGFERRTVLTMPRRQ